MEKLRDGGEKSTPGLGVLGEKRTPRIEERKSKAEGNHTLSRTVAGTFQPSGESKEGRTHISKTTTTKRGIE